MKPSKTILISKSKCIGLFALCIIFLFLGFKFAQIYYFQGFESTSDLTKDKNFKNYNIHKITTNSIESLKIDDDCLEIMYSEGISMLPEYPEDTFVVVDKCVNSSELSPGQVIIFNKDNSETTIFHRIYAINYEKGLILTKGDNNYAFDKTIKFEQIIGVEIGHVTVKRYLKNDN